MCPGPEASVSWMGASVLQSYLEYTCPSCVQLSQQQRRRESVSAQLQKIRGLLVNWRQLFQSFYHHDGDHDGDHDGEYGCINVGDPLHHLLSPLFVTVGESCNYPATNFAKNPPEAQSNWVTTMFHHALPPSRENLLLRRFW